MCREWILFYPDYNPFALHHLSISLHIYYMIPLITYFPAMLTIRSPAKPWEYVLMLFIVWTVGRLLKYSTRGPIKLLRHEPWYPLVATACTEWFCNVTTKVLLFNITENHRKTVGSIVAYCWLFYHHVPEPIEKLPLHAKINHKRFSFNVRDISIRPTKWCRYLRFLTGLTSIMTSLYLGCGNSQF